MEEIDNVQWGVLMARKGAVPKDRLLNGLTFQHSKPISGSARRRARRNEEPDKSFHGLKSGHLA